MFYINRYRLIALFNPISLLLICLVSCGTNATETEQEIILPENNLNYTEHIRPLIVRKCAFRGGCHSSFEPARGLDLTIYQNLETHYIDGSVPLMIKGDGQSSFLYNILLGSVLGRPRMPYNEAPLSSNNYIGIRQWIDESAPEFP